MSQRKQERGNGIEVEPPASLKSLTIYREEVLENGDSKMGTAHATNEETIPNLQRRMASDAPRLKTRNRHLKICTWNVRTLYQIGKLDNLIQELKGLNIDIAGLSEVRWIGGGEIQREGYSMIYSGGRTHSNGTALILKKELHKSLMGYWQINERMMLIKLAAKPFNIAIIQVYAPTTDHTEEELEVFYESLQMAIKAVKSDEVLIVMGDMNAKVGSEKVSECMGKFGLGNLNERGRRMLYFCEENNLKVMNTFFQHPARRLYTWKSPGDVTRNQIDYFMIKDRFKNCVKQVKAYPGADIGSDHNPLVARVEIKLKVLKSSKRKNRKDLSTLTDENIKNAFVEEVSKNIKEHEFQDTGEREEGVMIKWELFKKSLISAADHVIPEAKYEKNKPWMTENILEMMKERKVHKNTSLYKALDKEIKNKCRKAKESWYQGKCKELEDLEKRHNQKKLHREIKEMACKKRKNQHTKCIKTEEGNIVFEKDEILERWAKYAEKLFTETRCSKPQTSNLEGPPILKWEVSHAIKELKTGKAAGEDGIFAEMLKALGEREIRILTDICNNIYDTGVIPQDLLLSTFIPIPKTPNSLECTNFRIISLMSHVTKLLLKIILNRNNHKLAEKISSNQSGFKQNCGTREGIFNLRMIIERCLEKQKDLFLGFVDYSKAFDSVSHEKMIHCLEKTEMDGKDIRLLITLYWNQSAKIRIGEEYSNEFQIMKGVRQGCVISPLLFNIYTEEIFREVENIKGISVGGMNVNNLRYADDTVLMAESEEDLKGLIEKVKNVSKEYGLLFNLKKTKIMCISKKKDKKNINIKIDNVSLQQVESYIYLGSMITDDGKSSEEIKRRIEIARKTFAEMKETLTSREITLETRTRILRCYVWSTLLYGAETWTISKKDTKKLEAFEMWTLRRMMKISWKERKTNEEVIAKTKEKRRLLMKDVKKRKARYLGHLLRHESIQKSLLEGMIEGKRDKGRQRRTWMDDIELWTGLDYRESKREAQFREWWRLMVVNLLDGDDT